MGASLVKGRGHEPRTAALTGQGSTSANRGEPGKYPGEGTLRAASQQDHLGKEATVVGDRCAVKEEGNPTSVHWMVSSPKGRSPAACRANFLVLETQMASVLRQHARTPSRAWDERCGCYQNPEQNAQGGGRENYICFQTPLPGVRHAAPVHQGSLLDLLPDNMLPESHLRQRETSHSCKCICSVFKLQLHLLSTCPE